MPLDDIVARILDRAKAEAEKILSEAHAAADAIGREADERLTQEDQRAEEQDDAEARSVRERLAAGAELEARKESLAARQKVIDDALAEAVRALAESEEDVYIDFFRSTLRAASLKGEVEMFVSENDLDLVRRHLGGLQAVLNEQGEGTTLRLAETTLPLAGGFVLRQGRIEFNASVEAIRRSKEDDLRATASSLLFPPHEAS